MSRYTTSRVLWEVAADADLAKRFQVDPEDILADRELSDDERAALSTVDVRRLFQLGVHPFLLYNFAMRLNGGFSLEFMASYVGKLEGLQVGNLET